MSYIYISYSKEHIKDARNLYNDLNKIAGFTVWMADESLHFGESWRVQVEIAIKRSDIVLVLLSPNVNPGTSFVDKEIQYAQALGKLIIPIMVEVTKIPLGIQGLRYFDFTTDMPSAYGKLLRTLQELSESIPPSNSLPILPEEPQQQKKSIPPSNSLPTLPEEPQQQKKSVPPSPQPKSVTTLPALPVVIAFTLLAVVIIGGLFSFAPSLFSDSKPTPAFNYTSRPPDATRIPNIIMPSGTDMPTATNTATDMPTRTVTLTPTFSLTRTARPIHTSTSTGMLDPSSTPTPTRTPRPTSTRTPTASPSPTNTATVTPTQLPLAAYPIGNASLYPFYDSSLVYPETMSVELQLIFDDWFITPTPFGLITVVPATQTANRPTVNPDFSIRATPPSARDEVPLDNVPPFIVAELRCLESSFTGCDRKEVMELALSGINSWTWTIQAIEGIRDKQDLSLYLYAANPDGSLRSQREIWRYDFEVTVDEGKTLADWLVENGAVILGSGTTILVTIIGGYFALRQIRIQQQPKTSPTTTSAKPKPSAFISYRRQVSEHIARNLHTELEIRGADAFIDRDDLNKGDFNENLRREIRERDYFIVVLVPKTLESAWVVDELEYALQLEKTIIPVMADGFDMYKEKLPLEVKELAKNNGVILSSDYYKASIDKIAKFLGLEETPK